MIAAKTNLADVLPRPYVELAIQIARGSSEFLKKGLVEALVELKDDNLRATFMQSNRRAAAALTDYAAWLEKEKLPKATPQFALGEEKYRRFLAQTELVDLPPDKILELGLSELKREQEIFAEAAKKVDADKPAREVFRQIQSEHPTVRESAPGNHEKAGGDPQIRGRSQAGHDPDGSPGPGERDSGTPARDQFRFDGHARAPTRNGPRKPTFTSPRRRTNGPRSKRTSG